MQRKDTAEMDVAAAQQQARLPGVMVVIVEAPTFFSPTSAPDMGRVAVALCLLAAAPAVAQSRCKLGHVRQADGSFRIVGCDELLLHGEHIGDEGVKQLAKALKSDTRLRLLDLWSNGIGPAGASALAEALAVNSKLDKLYMNENTVGADGAEALIKALASPKSALTSLWLSRNKLGDAGAKALAAGLTGGKTRRLQVLDLWENGITPQGGAALATALRTNHALLTLEIRGNTLGDEGARAFAELMPHSRALSTLDLSSNGISPVGTATLLRGLKASTANPYLVLFVEHVPHMQATSWEQKGRPNAP